MSPAPLPFGGGGGNSSQQQQEFFGVSHDHLPVGTIPLLAVSASPAYTAAVSRFVQAANAVFADFLASEEGRGFYGQVGSFGQRSQDLLPVLYY